MKRNIEFLNFKSVVFTVFVVLSTLLMLGIILPYTSWERDVDFLKTKQFIVHLDYYRASFYTHIFSSVFVLCSGAFLFSKFVLNRHPLLHRNLGKLYVLLILVFSAPSGLIISFYANGGIWVKLSFFILTPLWWYFTYMGYRTIKKGKVREHRKWMIRSFALTLSAISLRLMQFILGLIVVWDPAFQYLFVSWVSWIGNLILAEFYIKKMYAVKPKAAIRRSKVVNPSINF